VLGRIGKDLLPRLASAIVLVLLVGGVTWRGGFPFAALVTLIAVIVSWEWGRIIRGGAFDLVMLVHIGVVLFSIALSLSGLIGLAILALIAGAILVNLLSFGRHPGLSALGVPYAGLPAIALLWFRADQPFGLWVVAFLLLCVIATDVGAYFSGRLIGGPKLAPKISPNKTWAGLLGAMAASGVIGALFGWYLLGGKVVPLAVLAVVLAIVAQAGDLGESMLKRAFGAKDASNIIPGHGGFMDRVDGLITAVVFAALMAAILNVRAPAKALLLW
jgi:phosphatidate cytidylyltransferase